MAGVFQQPALFGLLAADQLHAAIIIIVGRAFVLRLPPAVICRRCPASAGPDIRTEAVPQHHAAFVDFLRSAVVRSPVARRGSILRVEPGDGFAELRIVPPAFDWRARHRAVDQPGLQALKTRVDRHQPVQRGGAGARHAGNDHRAEDWCGIETGVVLHRPDRLRPAAQYADHLPPRQPPAAFMEMRIEVHRAQHRGQPGKIVGRAEIVAAGFARDDVMQFVRRMAEVCRRGVAVIHRRSV